LHLDFEINRFEIDAPHTIPNAITRKSHGAINKIMIGKAKIDKIKINSRITFIPETFEVSGGSWLR